MKALNSSSRNFISRIGSRDVHHSFSTRTLVLATFLDLAHAVQEIRTQRISEREPVPPARRTSAKAALPKGAERTKTR